MGIKTFDQTQNLAPRFPVVDSVPTDADFDDVKNGLVVIYDDGEGDVRLYVRADGAWTYAGALAPATALTAADGSTVDGTYGTEEADVIANNVVRIGEIEDALVAAGILTAGA